ncbi:hypothetical protein EXIGLDRAFT_701543 [Exidia glandulosa HHB12029]|uniref:Uncharacterized protein n=1 Tax=Exidia glandulosa HHB12029 TaxID=1314781 RepID=A0A165CWI8_EXIGL|nr:hypothetical protein EXIGLDRAFT_701543 [Exidia glandulosa HHB12029]
MARVAHSVSTGADPAASEKRVELDNMRSRARLWRRLKGLFPVEPPDDVDEHVSTVEVMLERWILLDQFDVPRSDCAKVSKRFDELCAVLAEYEESFADTRRVSRTDQHAFATRVADCALFWASSISAVAGDQFSDEEYAWIAVRDPAAAAKSILVSRPNLDAAYAALEERKRALLDALGEDNGRKSTTPEFPAIEERMHPQIVSSKRSTLPSPSSQSPRKRQRVILHVGLRGEEGHSNSGSEGRDESSAGPNGVKDLDVAEVPLTCETFCSASNASVPVWSAWLDSASVSLSG